VDKLLLFLSLTLHPFRARLGLQLAAAAARPLHCGRRSMHARGGRRSLHAHDLFGHAVGFLLQRVVRLAHRQLGLNGMAAEDVADLGRLAACSPKAPAGKDPLRARRRPGMRLAMNEGGHHP